MALLPFALANVSADEAFPSPVQPLLNSDDQAPAPAAPEPGTEETTLADDGASEPSAGPAAGPAPAAAQPASVAAVVAILLLLCAALRDPDGQTHSMKSAGAFRRNRGTRQSSAA